MKARWWIEWVLHWAGKASDSPAHRQNPQSRGRRAARWRTRWKTRLRAPLPSSPYRGMWPGAVAM